MNIHVAALVLLLATGIILASLIVVAGYKWGRFAAKQALIAGSPKWKAYALAIIPSVAFSLSFAFDHQLEELAFRTFWVLATPAVIATCFRYNRPGQEFTC